MKKKFEFFETLKRAHKVFLTSYGQGRTADQIVDDLVDRGFERKWAEKKVADYLKQVGEQWRRM